MSVQDQAARAFVDGWIANHISAIDLERGDSAELERAVIDCLKAAEEMGISPTTIEHACGSLRDYIDVQARAGEASAARLSGTDIA